MTDIWLTELPDAEPTTAPWMASLVFLGSRLAHRAASNPPNHTTVVVLSLPVRDFAAALIACGWAMATKTGPLPDRLETLRSLEPGTWVRAVYPNDIVEAPFVMLDEDARPARLRFRNSMRLLSELQAIARRPELEEERCLDRPSLGPLARLSGFADAWPDRLAGARTSLAVVGTRTWLERDFKTQINCRAEDDDTARIADLTLAVPDDDSMGLTRIYTQSRLEEIEHIAPGADGVILDGNGAFRVLSLIQAPVVTCLVDRSVPEANGAEQVHQYRATRGTPIDLNAAFRWRPPPGVEAAAFTVPQ